MRNRRVKSNKPYAVDENGLLVFLADYDKKKIAREIIKGDVLTRKSEQTVSPASLGLFLLGVFVVGWWISSFNNRVKAEEARIIARTTQRAEEALFFSASPTLPYSTQASPLVTPTPIIIRVEVEQPSTVTSAAQLQYFKLSFYDPAIGVYFPEIASVNCADWDGSQCRSLMSNGDSFMNWYGRGVACPPPLRLGDLVRVVYPSQLAGDWTCVDRGGAIVEGYLDFLLKYPDMIWTGYNLNLFPWASTVQAYVNP